VRAGGVAFDESVVGRGGAGYLWPPPRRDGGFVPRHSLAPPLRPGAKPEAVLEEEAASPAAAEDAGDAFAHDPEARRASRADVQRAPPARRVLGSPLRRSCVRRARDACAPGAQVAFKREVAETFLRCVSMGFDQARPRPRGLARGACSQATAPVVTV